MKHPPCAIHSDGHECHRETEGVTCPEHGRHGRPRRFEPVDFGGGEPSRTRGRKWRTERVGSNSGTGYRRSPGCTRHSMSIPATTSNVSLPSKRVGSNRRIPPSPSISSAIRSPSGALLVKLHLSVAIRPVAEPGDSIVHEHSTQSVRLTVPMSRSSLCRRVRVLLLCRRVPVGYGM